MTLLTQATDAERRTSSLTVRSFVDVICNSTAHDTSATRVSVIGVNVDVYQKILTWLE